MSIRFHKSLITDESENVYGTNIKNNELSLLWIDVLSDIIKVSCCDNYSIALNNIVKILSYDYNSLFLILEHILIDISDIFVNSENFHFMDIN